LKPASALAGGSLTAGTYYYVVTAVDANGDETLASNEQSTTIAGGQISLTWTASMASGLNHYNIYRGSSAGGENLLIGTAAGGATGFTDNGTYAPGFPKNALPPVGIASPGTSTTRTETITFYNGVGSSGVAPNPSRGKIPVQLSPGDNQEQVTQKLIAALQAAVTDGGFLPPGTTLGNNPNYILSDIGNGRIEVGGGPHTTIVVDASGSNSASGGALTGTPIVLWGDTQKDPIVGNSASGGAGAYNFWFNVGQTIYVDKSASPTGAAGSAAHPYTSIQAALAQPTLNAIVATTGGTLAVNTYYYMVTAYDASGGETLASNEQSATNTAAKPALSLSWSSSTMPGLAGYRIYRGASAGGESQLIATVPAGTTSYIDLNSYKSGYPQSKTPPAGIPAGQEVNLRVEGNANATLATSISQAGNSQITAGDQFSVAAGTFSGTFEFTTIALNPGATPGSLLSDGNFAVLPNFGLPTANGQLAQNIAFAVQAALNAAVQSLASGATATLRGNGVTVGAAQTYPPTAADAVDYDSNYYYVRLFQGQNPVTVNYATTSKPTPFNPLLTGVTQPSTYNNLPYLVGTDQFGNPLVDDSPNSSLLQLPKNMVMMVDAGALFKLEKANIEVGSSAVNIDDSQSALQVLWIPGEQAT
ncbi:MAG: hypothetical protein ACREHD_23460, partial [Pirellulales bacterium]